MKNRPNNGLIDYELQRKMNEKNIAREPLIMGVCEWTKIGTVFSVEFIWKSMEL